MLNLTKNEKNMSRAQGFMTYLLKVMGRHQPEVFRFTVMRFWTREMKIIDLNITIKII